MEICAEERGQLPAEGDVFEEENAADHIAELQLDAKLLLEQLIHGGLLRVKGERGERYVEGGDAADDVGNRIHNSVGRRDFEDRSGIEVV